MPDSTTQTGINRFISKDGKTITLPVPLGTETYTVGTSCGHFCYYQKEMFDQHFPPKDSGRCSGHMPCHTVPWDIYVHPLKFNNMEAILEAWGDRTFATRAEAEARMEAIIKEHRIKMRELGFHVDSLGRGCMLNPDESED